MAKAQDQEQADQILPALDRINRGPFGGEVSNSGVVRKVGNAIAAAGSRSFTDSASLAIDGDTMMAEGSIGKVRYAGLAYMLQQDEVIDLQQNAREFFLQDHVREFLDRRYPRQNVQAEILKLFSGGNEAATLADLTTHYAGTGDLTRDQAKLFDQPDGITRDYNLPTMLKIPEDLRVIPRDEHGKPRAQSDSKTPNSGLPMAELGEHQYSNLGYVLLATAMEAAYANKRGVDRSYQQLVDRYMLHPTEGRAVGKGLAFDSSKYADQVTAADNVNTAHWQDKQGQQVDGTKFKGAHAAGSMLTSVNDSTRYFTEFFRGFPGTPEYGQPDVNKFFSKETIEQMRRECEKHPPCNQKEIDEKGANSRYQGPGFVVTVDKVSGRPICYDKGGETFGYVSLMKFDPRTNTADVTMIARENISEQIAQKAGVKLRDLVGAYTKDKKCDRAQMYKDFQEEKGIAKIHQKVADYEKAKLEKAKDKFAVDGPNFRNALNNQPKPAGHSIPLPMRPTKTGGKAWEL